MGNLYKFDTLAKYNDNKNSLPYINVSYVSENDTVYYNDEKSEIEQQPLTYKIITLPDTTYCRFRFYSNDYATYVKYKINDGDWIDADNLSDISIDNIQLNDEIQIVANWRRGIASIAVWRNESWGDWIEGARVKVYGNWFSTVNGFDYKTNPHFDKNKDDRYDSINPVCGEAGWLIEDISGLWIPTRYLTHFEFYRFYQYLDKLKTPTDIRLETANDDHEDASAFIESCINSNITTGTISAEHSIYRSYERAFDNSSINTLMIEKLSCNLEYEIAGGCSNLTTIYNYTNYSVKITDDFNNIPATGTLYYVDYGQDMAYDPTQMVPSGWTCTAIQNPNT